MDVLLHRWDIVSTAIFEMLSVAHANQAEARMHVHTSRKSNEHLKSLNLGLGMEAVSASLSFATNRGQSRCIMCCAASNE